MQVHEYSHGSKAVAAGRYFVRFDRCHIVQTNYWIVDVPDEHQTSDACTLEEDDGPCVVDRQLDG
jgi:hypothetical protein